MEFKILKEVSNRFTPGMKKTKLFILVTWGLTKRSKFFQIYFLNFRLIVLILFLNFQPPDEVSALYMYSLFSASVFYFITAITYALLWDTQNTHGWTTFSLVVAQFFMCIFIGNAHRLGIKKEIGTRDSALCVSNGRNHNCL